jgi:PleD family two-component response regulator
MPKKDTPRVPHGLDTSAPSADNARRVLIVEDRAFVVDGLRMIVEADGSFKVAAGVPARMAALQACKKDRLAVVLVSSVGQQGGGTGGPERVSPRPPSSFACAKN